MSEYKGNRKLRLVLSTTSLVLPALTLVPLGSLWLWEHGYLIHWAVVAFSLVMIIVGLQWWVLRRSKSAVEDEILREHSQDAWNAREKSAWQAVEKFADNLTPDDVSSEGALRQLALRTIQLVASRMHPGDTDPLWNFTVPDALLMAERVARRLRPVVLDNIPLGDQLTVRQVMRLYQWRGAVDWAERAYDIWRIVRVLNPATAIANEARERITRKVYASLRDEFTVRLAQGYIREVARAAIDLYSGRLGGAVAPRPIPVDIDEGKSAEIENFPDKNDSRFSWRRFGRQARNAGKTAAGSLFRWRK